MKQKLIRVRKYIIARAQEVSTWRGITLMITAAGISLDPDSIESIMFGGMFIAGILGAFFPDRNKKQD